MIRRLVGIAYLAIIVAAVAVGVAIHYRTELVTTVVETAADPFDVSIGRVEFNGLAGATASDVVLRLPGSSEPVARIARVRVAGSIRGLLAGELSALEVDGAEVQLDEAFFDALGRRRGSPAGSPASSRPAAGTPDAPKLSIHDLRITNASFSIARRDFPRISFQLEHEATDLAVGGAGGFGPIRSAGQRLVITDLQATAPETSGAPGAVLAESPALEAVVASASSQGLHLSRLAIDRPNLALQPAAVDAITNLLVRPPPEPGPPDPGTRKPEPRESPPPSSPGVRIDELVVIGGKAEAKGLSDTPPADAPLQVKLPDSSMRFEASGSALDWQPDRGLVSGAAAVDLTDIEIAGLAAAPAASAEASFEADRITLANVALRSPTLTWTPSVPAMFAFRIENPPATGSATADAPAEENGDPAGGQHPARPIALRRLRVADARLDAREIGPLQRITATAEGEWRDLEWLPEGSGFPNGSELQRIALRDVAIEVNTTGDGPSAPVAPAFRAGEFTVELRPDDWRTGARVDTIAVRGLQSRLSRDDLLTLAEAAGPSTPGTAAPHGNDAAQPAAAPGTPPAPLPGPPVVEHLTIEDAPFVVEATPELGVPAATGTASIRSYATPDGIRWLATLDNLHVAPTLDAPLAGGSAATDSPPRTLNPFATVQEVRAAINPATFLSTRSIEDVTFAGAHLVAGRDLVEWSESTAGGAGDDTATRPEAAPRDPAAEPAPTTNRTDAAEPPARESAGASAGTVPAAPPGWTIDRLTFDQSIATLQDVVPGLPPVTFALDTTLEAVPLSRDGLLASRRPQRVEISNASIRSQLEPLYSVADLRSIFLDFTLAGLLERRVDRIEIASPVLYVGEHLFWYIDFYRKFESDGSQQGEQTASSEAGGRGLPLFADAGTGALAFAAGAASPLAGPPDLREPDGWTIDVIEAHNGRMVLAPKGIPIPSLPELPFSGRTRLVDSQLAFTVDTEELASGGNTPLLQLTIPEGDYPIRAFNLDWDLDLLGLSGDIAFNLPIESRSNNLVQTLRATQVWFEQVGGRDVFLSVTYDQFGVYAQFGGETFGGYANGEFNLYLDEKYSWDGWVTGTNVGLRSLTDALTPEYCRMTGTADIELVANGDLASLESLRANGFFVAREGGGEVDVLALSELDAALPDDLAAIPRALAEAGINTIRHFTYDTARIDFEALGREGRLNLDLQGPSGVRAVEINVHDERYRTPAR